LTLALRYTEAQSRIAYICQQDPATSAAAEAWLLDAFEDCLLALADEGPHIRKSETACTIACPACRLRRLVEEAMG
jgi:hypothetical protein